MSSPFVNFERSSPEDLRDQFEFLRCRNTRQKQDSHAAFSSRRKGLYIANTYDIKHVTSRDSEVVCICEERETQERGHLLSKTNEIVFPNTDHTISGCNLKCVCDCTTSDSQHTLLEPTSYNQRTLNSFHENKSEILTETKSKCQEECLNINEERKESRSCSIHRKGSLNKKLVHHSYVLKRQNAIKRKHHSAPAKLANSTENCTIRTEIANIYSAYSTPNAGSMDSEYTPMTAERTVFMQSKRASIQGNMSGSRKSDAPNSRVQISSHYDEYCRRRENIDNVLQRDGTRKHSCLTDKCLNCDISGEVSRSSGESSDSYISVNSHCGLNLTLKTSDSHSKSQQHWFRYYQKKGHFISHRLLKDENVSKSTSTSSKQSKETCLLVNVTVNSQQQGSESFVSVNSVSTNGPRESDGFVSVNGNEESLKDSIGFVSVNGKEESSEDEIVLAPDKNTRSDCPSFTQCVSDSEYEECVSSVNICTHNRILSQFGSSVSTLDYSQPKSAWESTDDTESSTDENDSVFWENDFKETPRNHREHSTYDDEYDNYCIHFYDNNFSTVYDNVTICKY